MNQIVATTPVLWRFVLTRLSLCLMIALLIVCFSEVGFAQDFLMVRTSSSDTIRKRKGTIEQWQGFSITLSNNGSQKEYDSSLVVDWQTTWPATYESGNRLAGAGKTNQAIQQYLAALTQEKRPWAQRIIRSKLMAAYQLVGNSSAAAQEFRVIIKQDPNSRFINKIPLPWSNRVSRVAGASDWLDSDDTAIRLLGAGWSLTSQTNQQKKAASVLDELAADLDPRIRDLAAAQLWRLRTRLNLKQVQQWQRVVDEMEPGNRAGALLILANAQLKQGDLDNALLNWMKIITLHEQQSSLVAASLYQIASALKSHSPDAASPKTYPKAEQFFAELQQRFPESIWAQQAMFDPSKN